jgi:hypothetical protein
VSFQIATMKVLSSYPTGKASLADLKRDLAILTTSGADWTQRMKRLAARAPDLDAFSRGFIERDATGWSITAAGRAFLDALERPVPDARPAPSVIEATDPKPSRPAPTAFQIIGRRDRKMSRRRQQSRVAR